MQEGSGKWSNPLRALSLSQDEFVPSSVKAWAGNMANRYKDFIKTGKPARAGLTAAEIAGAGLVGWEVGTALGCYFRCR